MTRKEGGRLPAIKLGVVILDPSGVARPPAPPPSLALLDYNPAFHEGMNGALVGIGPRRRERLRERLPLSKNLRSKTIVVGDDRMSRAVLIRPNDLCSRGDRERGWRKSEISDVDRTTGWFGGGREPSRPFGCCQTVRDPRVRQSP